MVMATQAKEGAAAGAPGLTAAQLLAEVQARYARPEWHCEAEVTLDRRRLDVVAFNLWGARGYRIVGFEVKVSRGDWLRELAAFEKSAGWHAVVDAFYVVTPGGLVRPDELPAGWGLLELRGSRMFTKVQAAARAPRPDLPREISARFLGRVLDLLEAERREGNYQARQEIHAELTTSIERRLREEFGDTKGEHERVKAELKSLREALGADEWDSAERLADAVRIASALGERGLAHEAHRIASVLRWQHEVLGKILGELEAIAPVVAPAAEVAHGR